MKPIDRIENKLDRVIDILSLHGEHLARHSVLHEQNTKSLDHHIARTDALEEKLEIEARKINEDMETALLPIKSLKWLGKVLAGLLVVGTLISLFLKMKA